MNINLVQGWNTVSRVIDMHGDLQRESPGSYFNVQDNTCRGRGHFVAAALQAACSLFVYLKFTVQFTLIQ